MTILIPPGFAQITVPLRNQALLRPAAITFGITVDNPLPDGDAAFEIANSVQEVFMDTLGQLLDASVTVGPTRITIGTSNPSEPITGEGTTTEVGGATFNSSPPQVAVLLKKVTSRGGRRGRGRMFLPWFAPTSTINEAGQINSDSVADIQTQANSLLTDLFDAGNRMVLLHNEEGGTSAGSPNAVQSLIVQNQVATQRRRVGR